MIEHAGWLVVWGVVVGLDLVSVAQTMLARPLVAGSVAGVIVGDPVTGAALGALLELCALDVLPVGGARYPDYGLGAIAATATAAGAPWLLGMGLGVGVGLLVAHAGGVGVHVVRLRNAKDVERHTARLNDGDMRAIRAVHFRALARDATRALIVTAGGLLLAAAAHRWFPVSPAGARYLAVGAAGAAAAGAAHGALRVSANRRWVALGLIAGLIGVWLR